ncbi:hypothetical protein E2P86_07885 [Sphingobacterium psychroaquaticum]|uniref:hypothetical protein n=1 Tax=Sphingobacterium psychroaquaticum TaxID=561061 RepID=UPI00106B9246|nr:hypothetical protein [Sphingobacterium psychroaquaticum]QBQ41076.1 hypothetical protein E2P86_07885 [Sphingobacterium psychroaquaticum]
MKKVKFIKDHVNGIKKGQVGEFSDGRANYLVRNGVAEYVEGAEPKQAAKQEKAKAKQAVKKDEPCKTC